MSRRVSQDIGVAPGSRGVGRQPISGEAHEAEPLAAFLLRELVAVHQLLPDGPPQLRARHGERLVAREAAAEHVAGRGGGTHVALQDKGLVGEAVARHQLGGRRLEETRTEPDAQTGARHAAIDVRRAIKQRRGLILAHHVDGPDEAGRGPGAPPQLKGERGGAARQPEHVHAPLQLHQNLEAAFTHRPCRLHRSAGGRVLNDDVRHVHVVHLTHQQRQPIRYCLARRQVVYPDGHGLAQGYDKGLGYNYMYRRMDPLM